MASLYDETWHIPRLSAYTLAFPDPGTALDEGLLAYGGDLSAARLLLAYRMGIFPWYSADDPILWWSPDPRLLLFPHDFIVRKSFHKRLKNFAYHVTFDHAFEQVIRHCAGVSRKGQHGSWIVPEMIEAFVGLHYDGYAHSVEVWHEGVLIGGLYGLAMGGVFFGESMFSLRPDGSKIAFKALSDVLAKRGYDFIDCQLPTEHMQRLGAVVVRRSHYLKLLADALAAKGDDIGNWRAWQWHYKG